MIAYRRGERPGTALVTFVIEPPPEYIGGAIAVVGNFNDWNPNCHEFAPGDDGRWRVNVELHTGRRYAFRYVTESGHWFNEPDAHDHRDNGAGQTDCVLDLTGPAPGEHPAEGDLDLDAIRDRARAGTDAELAAHARADITALLAALDAATTARNTPVRFQLH